MAKKAGVSSFQSMSTLDGSGIRCVIFMQGCALRCGYCHNPETWSLSGGEEYSSDEMLRKILRCKPYFGEKGGVTVSGGEPLLHADWLCELFDKCHENGVNTALDTAGSVWNADVSSLLDKTDLCLLDYKMTNSADYLGYIGCDIEKPRFFMSELSKRNIKTWIRHVVVPTINDSEESIRLLKKFTAQYDNIERVELLPFHKMCHTKYEELGIPFRFSEIPETDAELIEHLRSVFDSAASVLLQ